MIVHQMTKEELADLFISLEELSVWCGSLVAVRLSAGVIYEVVPGGSHGILRTCGMGRG